MSINVTDLKKGIVFKEDGTPFLILNYTHTKMGRGAANIKVKVKNLKSGVILEKGFSSGHSVEEAEIQKRNVQFLYSDDVRYYFMDPETFEQMSIEEEIGPKVGDFLKEGVEVTLVLFEENPIAIELPITVDLVVAETGAAEKGNTVSAATKDAVLETGVKIKVPMFIKVGDIVKVNTETGSYGGKAK